MVKPRKNAKEKTMKQKILVDATVAPRPRKPYARIVASIAAGILIAMAATQLFSFDKFIELLDSYWLPGANGAVLGAVIVSLEVLALPYLLQMALSPAARLVSMIGGWLITMLWLGLGFFLQTTTHALESTGHLGTVIDTPPGMWTIFFAVGLLMLIVTSDWLLGGVRLKR